MCVIFRDCAAPNIMMDGRQLYPKGLPSFRSIDASKWRGPSQSHIEISCPASQVLFYRLRHFRQVRQDLRRTSSNVGLLRTREGGARITHTKAIRSVRIGRLHSREGVPESFLDVRGPFRRLFFVEV